MVQDEGHSTEVECHYDRTQTPKEIYWMSPTGEKITKESTAISKKLETTYILIFLFSFHNDML